MGRLVQPPPAHEAIDDFTPVAVEDLHYAHITALAEVGGSTP
jgi:hypothetical protein